MNDIHVNVTDEVNTVLRAEWETYKTATGKFISFADFVGGKLRFLMKL